MNKIVKGDQVRVIGQSTILTVSTVHQNGDITCRLNGRDFCAYAGWFEKVAA